MQTERAVAPHSSAPQSGAALTEAPFPRGAVLVLANKKASAVVDDETFRALPHDSVVRFPNSSSETRALVLQAMERDARALVVAGGDGTLHHVVNALAPDFPALPLLPLPLGTGNDFARSWWGEPLPEVGDLLRLLEGDITPLRVDLLHATYTGGERYILNASAGGFAPRVDDALDPELKERWGRLAYLWSATKAVQSITPFRTELQVDEKRLACSAYNVVVANGRSIGGGTWINPEGKLDDGLAEVVVIPELPAGRLVKLCSQLLLASHLENEDLMVLKGREIRLSSDPPFDLNTDGEVVGTTPVRYQLLPGRLTVVRPPINESQPALTSSF